MRNMSFTALKLAALFFMCLDHMALYITGMPVWFHWIGRLAAPIFLFCMVWGMHYTSNRRLYLKRLYLAGIIMGGLTCIMNLIFSKAQVKMQGNIFVTFFLIGCVIVLYDEKKEKQRKLAGLMFISQIVALAMNAVIRVKFPFLSDVSKSLIPSVFLCEGSFEWIVLGLVLYLSKMKNSLLVRNYTLFCVFILGVEFWASGMSVHKLIYTNYQWMMLGALPLFLIQNGKRGHGYKYFFYVFYPVHIIVLFLVGNLLGR